MGWKGEINDGEKSELDTLQPTNLCAHNWHACATSIYKVDRCLARYSPSSSSSRVSVSQGFSALNTFVSTSRGRSVGFSNSGWALACCSLVEWAVAGRKGNWDKKCLKGLRGGNTRRLVGDDGQDTWWGPGIPGHPRPRILIISTQPARGIFGNTREILTRNEYHQEEYLEDTWWGRRIPGHPRKEIGLTRNFIQEEHLEILLKEASCGPWRKYVFRKDKKKYECQCFSIILTEIWLQCLRV